MKKKYFVPYQGYSKGHNVIVYNPPINVGELSAILMNSGEFSENTSEFVAYTLKERGFVSLPFKEGTDNLTDAQKLVKTLRIQNIQAELVYGIK